MRFSRFAVLGLAVTTMVGCSEPSDAPTTPNIPPLAYVRYINAVPDTLNTTVRFIDQVEYSPMTFVNVPFRGLGQGNYQPTAAGARKFRVFTADAVNFTTAGNTQILVDTTITFEAGKYYTLLQSGVASARRATLKAHTRTRTQTQTHGQAHGQTTTYTDTDTDTLTAP